VIANRDPATGIDTAIDPEAPLRSSSHRLGDTTIDLESGLRAAGDYAADRRHEDIENHITNHEACSSPARLR
jgi:hypothetical protein